MLTQYALTNIVHFAKNFHSNHLVKDSFPSPECPYCQVLLPARHSSTPMSPSIKRSSSACAATNPVVQELISQSETDSCCKVLCGQTKPIYVRKSESFQMAREEYLNYYPWQVTKREKYWQLLAVSLMMKTTHGEEMKHSFHVKYLDVMRNYSQRCRLRCMRDRVRFDMKSMEGLK